MALTKAQNKTVASHKEQFGKKHADVMRKELNKGKSVTQAHKKAGGK